MLEIKSLINLLSRLQSAFDEAILNGNSLEEVKKIYLQIKDTEKLLAERKSLNSSEAR